MKKKIIIRPSPQNENISQLIIGFMGYDVVIGEFKTRPEAAKARFYLTKKNLLFKE